MRIGVTGGRDFQDGARVEAALTQFVSKGDTFVHGAARGADQLAAAAAHVLGAIDEPHPAEWDKYGKSAGYRRNAEMAGSGLDLLLVFPGGKGTAMMKDLCEKAGIPVVEV